MVTRHPPPPYIGITGFMSCGEVDAVLRHWPANSRYRLMVGVLISGKTLADQTNRWPGRYPPIRDVGGIFLPSQRVLYLVHYNTKNPEAMRAELYRIHWLTRPYGDGFQLNMLAPSPGEICQHRKEVARAHPCNPRHGEVIVLQVGAEAMAAADYDPHRIQQHIVRYAADVNYVLLDPSGGAGQSMDIAFIRECLRELYAQPLLGNVGMGIAGGLCAETLPAIEPLVREFSDLSIDAEGRLRTPDTDALDLEATIAYVEVAHRVMSAAV